MTMKTTILLLVVTALLPSCASTVPDQFDLALNQTIARMMGDMGKEDAP